MRVFSPTAARRVAVPLAVLATLVTVSAGCSSSKKAATSTSTPAATVPSASGSGLSGSWSGHYGGAFQGTFTLNWQQSGSNLNGSIQLSAPATTLNINGSLTGSSIRFGTVGAFGITYTGSVSGHSMSGNYTVAAGSSSSGGSWSASKSS
jgi:hypothetical protein